MHVLRPLWAVLALVLVILVLRTFVVPEDFGIGERGYMYGWHRASDPQYWQGISVKLRGREYCKQCHPAQFTQNGESPHRIIQCENCHGLAGQHPGAVPKLTVDRSRDLCLRCHERLAYPSSQRGEIRGVSGATHNQGVECAKCHKPHKPTLGEKPPIGGKT